MIPKHYTKEISIEALYTDLKIINTCGSTEIFSPLSLNSALQSNRYIDQNRLYQRIFNLSINWTHSLILSRRRVKGYFHLLKYQFCIFLWIRPHSKTFFRYLLWTPSVPATRALWEQNKVTKIADWLSKNMALSLCLNRNVRKTISF